MYHGMNMQLAQRQEMIMTPQMIQSMEMLQMPLLELEQKIQHELMENPALELSDLKISDEHDNYDTDYGIDENSNSDFDDSYNDLRHADDIDYNWSESYDDTMPRRSYEDNEDRFDVVANTENHAESYIESLLKQIHLLDISKREVTIAEHIISSLDLNGYLSDPFEQLDFSEIAPPVTEEEFENILDEVQHLSPAGTAARNLQECLLLQLDTIDNPANLLASQIVENHLDDLAANRLPLIAKSLHASIEEIKDATNLIRNLSPHPVTEYSSESAQTARPDIIIDLIESKSDDISKAKTKVIELEKELRTLELNNHDEKSEYQVRAAKARLHDAHTELRLYEHDGMMWKLRLPNGPVPEVSDTFLALYDNTGRGEIIRNSIMNDPEKKAEFEQMQKSLKQSGQNKVFRERFQSAFDIVRAVQQRELTLTRVTREIVAHQKDYLAGRIPAPAPLMMKEVAEYLDIDIGTVSRAARDKFAQTPIGLKPLREFFTRSSTQTTRITSDLKLQGNASSDSENSRKIPEGGYSNIQIRNRVKELIDSEDKKKPLKDDQIQVLLEKEGIIIKRRTVAKHRLKLGYKNYSQRREY